MAAAEASVRESDLQLDVVPRPSIESLPLGSGSPRRSRTIGRFALTLLDPETPLFDPVSSEIYEILETYETAANLLKTRVLSALRAFRGYSAAPTCRRWGGGGRRFVTPASRASRACRSPLQAATRPSSKSSRSGHSKYLIESELRRSHRLGIGAESDPETGSDSLDLHGFEPSAAEALVENKRFTTDRWGPNLGRGRRPEVQRTAAEEARRSSVAPAARRGG